MALSIEMMAEIMDDLQEELFAISKREFYILKLLGKFQTIEFSLKLILLFKGKETERLTDVPQRDAEFSALENLSLGMLIKRFKRQSDDQDLVKCLEAVVPHRNAVAHHLLFYGRQELRDVFGAERVPSYAALEMWAAAANKCIDALASIVKDISPADLEAGEE